MATRNIVDTKFEVNNKSSFNINFRFVDSDGSVVTPSSAKVYVYVDGVGTTINNRDGSTNTSGFTTTDTNLINFDLAPADLTIADTSSASVRGFEAHRVIIEVLYNADADKYIREYIIKILHSPVFVT